MSSPAEQKTYTYGDYLQWDDEKRFELIDGEIYDMTPAPSTTHQRISIELSFQIRSYLGRQAPCEVFAAPFDVRLPEGNESDEAVHTVVQPDLVVVCDSLKLDDKGCRGAPDWIIEIISPSTAARDHIRKLTLYERHGVREYWIVDPLTKIVMVYHMNEDGRYGRPGVYSAEDRVESRVIEGLVIDLKEILEI